MALEDASDQIRNGKKTINQIREEFDLKPIGDELGNALVVHEELAKKLGDAQRQFKNGEKSLSQIREEFDLETVDNELFNKLFTGGDLKCRKLKWY